MASKKRRSAAVLLWGGRSKARIVDEMLRESGVGATVLVFDATLKRPAFKTRARFINKVGALKAALIQVDHFVVCIGGEHGLARYRTAKVLEKLGIKPLRLIHPKSYVEPTARVGKACQLMPLSVVHKFTTIGEHSILNTGCTIDHECVVGKGVHIMGRAAIAGKVTIGDFATIGTNATILPHIKIGEGSIVGAGAVVTKDVPPYSVVAGVPARFMKKATVEFHEDVLVRLMKKGS